MTTLAELHNILKPRYSHYILDEDPETHELWLWLHPRDAANFSLIANDIKAAGTVWNVRGVEKENFLERFRGLCHELINTGISADILLDHERKEVELRCPADRVHQASHLKYASMLMRPPKPYTFWERLFKRGLRISHRLGSGKSHLISANVIQ